MPKATSNRYDITVKDAITLIPERFVGTLAKSPMKDAGKYPRNKKPATLKPAVNHYDPDFIAEKLAEFSIDVNRQRLHAFLLHERRLLDRISDAPPPIPLLERIEPKQFTFNKDIPESLRFRRSKIMLREQELGKVINATSNRLGTLQGKADVRGVKDEHNEAWLTLMANFKVFKMTFKSKVDKYTNKQWRLIKKDLKDVKRIKFRDLDNSWENVCAEIAALGVQQRFVYV